MLPEAAAVVDTYAGRVQIGHRGSSLAGVDHDADPPIAQFAVETAGKATGGRVDASHGCTARHLADGALELPPDAARRRRVGDDGGGVGVAAGRVVAAAIRQIGTAIQ
jgi:hypothetical protein